MDAQNDRLISFLRTPGSYPHRPRNVQEIQTHISRVFIADSYVYKVKKPVSLGFLDFSTLERRRHYCGEEVRLNRRLCPEVYLGVVPISERGGEFALDDETNVVEYAVKMRTLEGGAFGHDRLAREDLGREDLDRVAETLAAFYDDESPTAKMAAWGRADRLAISTEENFEQSREFAGSLLPDCTLEAIRTYTRRFLDTQARLLNERRAGGRILDCHGDLHLEHLYFRGKDVCIYDCIEFNERLRTIDVASDVAFLAMDLDFHGRPDLSVYFGEQMADRLSDPLLLNMLDFYKAYRAVVRGKVEGMRSRDGDVEPAERNQSAERARAYFRLALRYAVAGSKPLVVAVMGRVATGKSSLARALGEALGWDVVSSDHERKQMAGMDPYVRGSEQEREALYAAGRTDATYDALVRRASEHVRRGRCIILDATYSRAGHREELRRTIKKAGAAYCFIELTAPDETIRCRLKERDDGQRSVSDARLEDFETLHRAYEAPDDLEDVFHFRIGSDLNGSGPLQRALQQLIRIDF